MLKQRRKLFSVARKFICGSNADIGKVSLSEGLLWRRLSNERAQVSKTREPAREDFRQTGMLSFAEFPSLTEFSL